MGKEGSSVDCSVQQVLLPYLFMGDSYIVAAVGFEELVHFSQGMSYRWVKGKKSLLVDWLILKHEQGKERPSWKELGSFRG